MMRSHNLDEIDLQIIDVDFFYDNETRLSGMIISWSSTIGFGEYTIYKSVNGTFKADSECMDREYDKDFGRKLMQLLMDMTEVE